MYVELDNEGDSIDTGNDSIAIVDNFQSVRGGRSLDVAGFTPKVIQAGHVIIKETATGNFKPMPVNSGQTAYAALPADHTYAHILIASVLTKKAMAGLLVRGTVNPAACPYPMATILADVKTALPLIDFRED